MELSTQDLHSQKEHTRLYKFPKFGVNRANIDEDKEDQKSLNQPVTTGWLSRHTTFEWSRTLRHDTMFLKCVMPWERALFGRRHEGAIFDSFDEFHHQKCAVKHYVINEPVMGRALQKHARGKNPQITSKQRDRWSL